MPISYSKHASLRKAVTKHTIAYLRDEAHVAGLDNVRRNDVLAAAVKAYAADEIKLLLQNGQARDPKVKYVTSILDSDYDNMKKHTEPCAKQIVTKGGIGFANEEEKERRAELKRKREEEKEAAGEGEEKPAKKTAPAKKEKVIDDEAEEGEEEDEEKAEEEDGDEEEKEEEETPKAKKQKK
jgi:hypothetical protein